MKGILIVSFGLFLSCIFLWVDVFIGENEGKVIDVISSDKIREEVFNDIEDQNHNSEVFDLMKRRTKESLSQGHVAIYEATNISSKRRRALLKELNKYYDKAICLFKYKRLTACQIDNEKRDREVPSNVIDRMYRNFEIPHKSEGFDEIIVDFDEKTNLYLSNKSKGGIGFLKDELLAIETYDDYKSLLCQLGLNQCIDMPQDSKWHTLSLSKHMYFCFRAVREYHWHDINLVIASMLHDISKPNVRTEDKDQKYAHYYGHENASAYDVIDILLRYVRIDIEDILEIAWLIGNHMKLKNNIDKDKFSNIIGYDDYLRLEALDNADNSAK